MKMKKIKMKKKEKKIKKKTKILWITMQMKKQIIADMIGRILKVKMSLMFESAVIKLWH